MKTLGLIGGTSWHSTVEYYRIINQQVNERLGGANSAKMLLYSVNFEELKPPADWSGWIEIANKLHQLGYWISRGASGLARVGINRAGFERQNKAQEAAQPRRTGRTISRDPNRV